STLAGSAFGGTAGGDAVGGGAAGGDAVGGGAAGGDAAGICGAAAGDPASMTGCCSGSGRERVSAAIMNRSRLGCEPRVTVPRGVAFCNSFDCSRISISFDEEGVSPMICTSRALPAALSSSCCTHVL